jgi:hypothetical protein
MYNTNKVLIGIVVFLVALTSPFWLNYVGAKGLDKAPKPELPDKAKMMEEYGFYKCVEPVSDMREGHMKLLLNWRNEVVRLDERTYESHGNVDESGKPLVFDKSLTRTCLKCHSNKKKFCDRCHTYADVKPYCWSCHVVPEGGV